MREAHRSFAQLDYEGRCIAICSHNQLLKGMGCTGKEKDTVAFWDRKEIPYIVLLAILDRVHFLIQIPCLFCVLNLYFFQIKIRLF